MRFGGSKRRVLRAGTLRRSQLVTTYGCGAVASLPRESVIIAGTDFWKQTDSLECRLQEETLQSYLRVKYFTTPAGENTESGDLKNSGVPAFRFPQWMFCPKCRRLASFDDFSFRGHPRCNGCKESLVPSRFVMACKNGHLDDFPYLWWVHRGNECNANRPPQLEIKLSHSRSGLDSIIISCRSCRLWRSMVGSVGKKGLEGFDCTGRRPWLNDKDSVACSEPMYAMLRGATNLHFPVNASALSVPPWSKRIQYELGKYWKILEAIVHDQSTFETVVKSMDLPEKLNCSPRELWQQARFKKTEGAAGGPTTWQEIMEGEYRAFEQGQEDDDGEFRTRAVQVPSLLQPYFHRVILVTRLQEVIAQLGFKRIDPECDPNDPSTFTPVWREKQEWLPAVEMKGEGIFILLQESAVSVWEQSPQVVSRYSRPEAQQHYLADKGCGYSPRYTVLHTLAHLFVKQIISNCGYSSASLKERIYCTFSRQNEGLSNEGLDMAGVLVYTAAPDSEGSLGGLVAEALPERLENNFLRMLESALWCSEDPLCAMSKGQGMDALNLAACHACTLLPETSCEKRNCFLDRAALTGVPENRSIGFFSELLQKVVTC